MNLLQITVAGSVDQETAPAALASFAASVTRCQNYAVVVTSIVTHSTPAAGSDAAPMVTSTVGGALTCASL